MQHLEVSGAVRHIYIYVCVCVCVCVTRRLKFNNVWGQELYLNALSLAWRIAVVLRLTCNMYRTSCYAVSDSNSWMI